jgi:hypothetical protein
MSDVMNITEEPDVSFKELRQMFKELRKSQEETDRQMKETDRQIKETNKRIGFLNNRFGEIVEYMIAPGLFHKFNDMGFNFNGAIPNYFRGEKTLNIAFEIDAYLENSEMAMLVEIKSKLTTEDVKEHIQRLEKMRAYADFHHDTRVFLGAVAGVVMTPLVKQYALEQGFYVIEPSGETFNITPPDGKPKEW